jgi:hypothetical protein
VTVKSLKGKVFNFSVEPIDYVDFIGIDPILSDYSNKNCDEIHMVEKVFSSKIEKVFVSSLGILMAYEKSKAREKHNKSTQKRGVGISQQPSRYSTNEDHYDYFGAWPCYKVEKRRLE